MFAYRLVNCRGYKTDLKIIIPQIFLQQDKLIKTRLIYYINHYFKISFFYR